MDTLATATAPKALTPSQIEDLRLAASKMNGVERRSFQAEMALKYLKGCTRLAETLFGWGRQNIEIGLAEKRTGITCVGLQSTFSGAKRWEEKQPEVALSLQQLAESYAQQDPTFKTSLAYTRLTAASALKELKELGFSQEQLPGASTMAQVLNLAGLSSSQSRKSQTSKKIAETDDIFNNIKEFQNLVTSESVKRLSIDCKATVNIGDYSRGGKTRGDNQASDHDMGCKEKYIPCGIVDEDNGQLHIIFGSSYKTSEITS